MRRILVILSFAVAAGFMLIYSAPGLLAQGSPISEVTASAHPQHYKGPCPAKITFTGRIHVNRYPMTLNCQWERSDGATGPVKVLRVPSAQTRVMTVTDTWQLGAPGQSKEIWEKLRVRTGNTDMSSAPAAATIDCR